MNGISFRSNERGHMIEHTADRRPLWPASTIRRPSQIIYMTSFTDDPDNSIAKHVLMDPMQTAAVYDVWLMVHLYGPNRDSNPIATNVRRMQWDRHGSVNNVMHFDMHVSSMERPELHDVRNWYDGVPRRIDYEGGA